jgi:hypothetical protein
MATVALDTEALGNAPRTTAFGINSPSADPKVVRRPVAVVPRYGAPSYGASSSNKAPRGAVATPSAKPIDIPGPASFNNTMPTAGVSARSGAAATQQRIFGSVLSTLPTQGAAGGSKARQFRAPPTTNMSMDSAMMHAVLHTKFLIPPVAAHLTGHALRQPNALPSNAGAMPASALLRDMSGETAPSVSAEEAGLAVADNKPRPVEVFTVVFDLDETLCCNRGPGKAVLRPGALDILRSLAALNSETVHVEIVMWTASVESLARVVAARLDPGGKLFTHFVFRDKRWFKESGYTKDLRLLGRPLERVVIIENSPMSVTLNRENSIMVSDFLGHAPHDCDLKAVKEVLEGWIAAAAFVPVHQFLAQHPKIDRQNNVLASPARSPLMATPGGAPRFGGLTGGLAGGRRSYGYGR